MLNFIIAMPTTKHISYSFIYHENEAALFRNKIRVINTDDVLPIYGILHDK